LSWEREGVEKGGKKRGGPMNVVGQIKRAWCELKGEGKTHGGVRGPLFAARGKKDFRKKSIPSPEEGGLGEP